MDFLRDIKAGALMMRKNPGLAVAMILVIGVSIGAIAAIYALVDTIILRVLPVQEPEKLVLLKWNAHYFPKTRAYIPWFQCANNSGKAADSGITGCSFSMPLYRQIESEQNVFEGISGFAGSGKLGANINGHAYIANGEYVSGSLFTILGVHAFLGRELSPQDDMEGAGPVALLSYGYWAQELGQDKSLIGTSLLLNGVSATIIGVMPPDFVGLDSGISKDLWLPLSLQPIISKGAFATIHSGSDFWWLSIIGRLKKGVSIKQAETAIDTIFLSSTDKGRKPEDVPHIKLVNAARGLASLNQEFSRHLFFLLIAAGGILLISCANVAGLLLAHSSSRKREMAVRLALGATPWKVLRQIYLENSILLIISAIFGILSAWWGATALARFLTENLQLKLQIDVHPDTHLFGFISIVAIFAGFLFVLPSAIYASRIHILQELKESSSHATGLSDFFHRRLNLGSVLVVLQVALSMAVLFTASLLLHTLTKLEAVNIGFNERNLLLLGIDPMLSGYKRQQVINLYGELQNRISSTPGVASVSYSEDTLFSGNSWSQTAYFQSNLKQSCDVYVLHISPDFLTTMKIPLFAGRNFKQQDMDRIPSEGTYIPVIINQAFAKQFGEQSPLGQHISLIERKRATLEIVGIAGDTKYGNIRDKAGPMVYMPFQPGRGFFEIRSGMDPMVLIPRMRQLTSEVASAVPLFAVKTQTQEIEQTIYRERLLANISLVFAFIGLGLACVGLYGLLSYQVLKQTQEIGVRLALGASQQNIFKLIITRGIALVIAGQIPGIALALGTARYVQSMLYDVRFADPFTIITTLVLFIAVGALACYFPARGAMNIDAATALRGE